MGLAVSGSIHNMSGCDVVLTPSCPAYLDSVRRAYPVMIIKAVSVVTTDLSLFLYHEYSLHGKGRPVKAAPSVNKTTTIICGIVLYARFTHTLYRMYTVSFSITMYHFVSSSV